MNYTGYDGASNLLQYTTTDGSGTNATYVIGLARQDGYREATITGSSGAATGVTTNQYDVNGYLVG